MTFELLTEGLGERSEERAAAGDLPGEAQPPARIARLLALAFVLALVASHPFGANAQMVADGPFEPGEGPTEPVKAVAVQADGQVIIGGAFQYPGGHSGVVRLRAGGPLDDSFRATTDGTVFSLKVQADGRILAGGAFQHVNGRLRPGLARLNPDGSLDESFEPRVAGTVFSVVETADGRILVGGFFSGVGGRTRRSVARLNRDGSLDESFDPGWGPDFYVFALAAQADGRVVLGGGFRWVGGQPRDHIARLNADGSLDAGFDPKADRPVLALAAQPDGRVLVGGEFLELAGQPTSYLGRLNPDGTRDAAFVNRGTNGAVRAVELQADGRVLVGGDFLQTDIRWASRCARLNADGSLDATFANPRADRRVNAVAGQADGRVVAGGEFTEMGGRLRRHIARLRADGSLDAAGPLDESFAPSPDIYAVYTAAALPDGRVLASVILNRPEGAYRSTLVRLNHDGSLDPAFAVDNRGAILTVAVQPDGRILVGGMFYEINGRPRNKLARLNSDGSLDEGFVADTGSHDDEVKSIIALADGRILVGGQFWAINSQPRTGVARLNPDGSVDASFSPQLRYPYVYSMALQLDGKVVVGGYLDDAGDYMFLTRLNADGSLDPAFSPRPDSPVQTLAVQPDGRILAGGRFTQIGGQPRAHIARLHPDGSADLDFNPGANDNVITISLQTDGRIYVGGRFTSIAGQPQNYLARLKNDGAFDDAFRPVLEAGGGLSINVRQVVLQADGRLIVNGGFTRAHGQPRKQLARLYNTDVARQELALDGGRGFVWERRGASPEVDRVTFELSEDGVNYTSLGAGNYYMGGWHVGGVDLPAGRAVFVRARGYFNTGGAISSGSAVESVRAILAPAPQP